MPRRAGRTRKKQPRPSTKAVKLDLNALEAAKRRVRHHPGVIGADYGYIYEGGVRTDRIGIRYHVRNKLPQRLLPSEQRLPDKVDGVRTDVLEAGFKPHRANPFAAASILQPGLSVGNVP